MSQFYAMDARGLGYHSNSGAAANLSFDTAARHADIASMYPEGSRQREFHMSVASSHLNAVNSMSKDADRIIGTKAEKLNVSHTQKKAYRSSN